MEKNVSPFKSALTYGVYFAIVSIIWQLIIWAASILENMGIMGAFVVMAVNVVIYIVLLIMFTKAYRNNELGGVITFGQAFTFGILVVICSSIITGVYAYVFNAFIDPEYTSNVMTAMQEKTYQFMVNRGVPEAQIDEAMRQFEMKEIPTPWKTVQSSLANGLITGGILSVISSAIIKKNVNLDAFEGAMEEVKAEE